MNETAECNYVVWEANRPEDELTISMNEQKNCIQEIKGKNDQNKRSGETRASGGAWLAVRGGCRENEEDEEGAVFMGSVTLAPGI